MHRLIVLGGLCLGLACGGDDGPLPLAHAGSDGAAAPAVVDASATDAIDTSVPDAARPDVQFPQVERRTRWLRVR
jgi:hypothetical protein